MSDDRDHSLIQQLEADARELYNSDNDTPAFAFVYNHNNQKGLQLKAPDIVLEYTNGVLIGRGCS